MRFDRAITEIVDTWRVLEEIYNESSFIDFCGVVISLPITLPGRFYNICKYRQEEKRGW